MSLTTHANDLVIDLPRPTPQSPLLRLSFSDDTSDHVSCFYTRHDTTRVSYSVLFHISLLSLFPHFVAFAFIIGCLHRLFGIGFLYVCFWELEMDGMIRLYPAPPAFLCGGLDSYDDGI
jgi:hypothetical protein